MRKLKCFTLVMLLVLSLILSVSLYGCSKSDREYSTNIDSTDTAILTIFTYDGSGEKKPMLMNLGHAFFSLENISDDEIMVGKKSVAPHSTITIGTWSVAEHFGVWYNLESNYIKFNGKYTGRKSISIGINSEDIDTISECISSMDNWGPLHNCSYFALTTWNKVATDNEKIDTPLIYTPTHIAKVLAHFDTCVTDKPIETDTVFGYFNGDTYVLKSFYDNLGGAE